MPETIETLAPEVHAARLAVALRESALVLDAALARRTPEERLAAIVRAYAVIEDQCGLPVGTLVRDHRPAS